MKKIWILNQYAVLPDMAGGTRHYDFSVELAKRGYQVKIFAAGFNHKLRKEILLNKENVKRQKVNGVEFIFIRVFPHQKNDFRRILNILSYTFKLFFVCLKEEKPEIIIASSFHPLTCIVGYILTRFKRAKFIAEIRDLWPVTAIDMGAISEHNIITKILKRMELYIYRKASKIIVLLPNAVEYIHSLGIPSEKVVYIPNGINVKGYNDILSKKVEDEEVNSILAFHQAAFKILYLGAIGRANALDVILGSALLLKEHKIDDIHFLIVGDGPEKERLIKRASELELTNVYFYDSLKKESIPHLLDQINANIVTMLDLPLYKYGISLNKLFDYLCSGKPIIFSGNVNNDIVKQSGCGISVPAASPKHIVTAILELYKSSEQERNGMGKKGKNYVRQFHDIPVLVNTLERVIN